MAKMQVPTWEQAADMVFSSSSSSDESFTTSDPAISTSSRDTIEAPHHPDLNVSLPTPESAAATPSSPTTTTTSPPAISHDCRMLRMQLPTWEQAAAAVFSSSSSSEDCFSPSTHLNHTSSRVNAKAPHSDLSANQPAPEAMKATHLPSTTTITPPPYRQPQKPISRPLR